MRIWISVLWLALIAPAGAAELRVGRAAVDITPPVGMPMGGYFEIRLNTATHDPLYAKALVLEQGGVKVALVACDLESLPHSFVDQARQLIAKTTGLPGDHVMISATHTHTGPEMSAIFIDRLEGRPAQIAKDYRAGLPGKIAEAVRRAEADLQPARAWAGIGEEDSIAFNRRFLMKDGSVHSFPEKLDPNIVRPVGPTDPAVPVVYFDSPHSKPLATYVNFAMHLDDVGGTEYSADYPYTLAKLLGAVKGSEMLTLFTIGAAGNVEQRDVHDPDPEAGHYEAAKLGTILAGAVLKTYKRLSAVEGPLRVRREIVALPVQQLKAGEVDQASETADRLVRNGPKGMEFLDLVQAFKVLAVADYQGRPLKAEVQVIALGDELVWVGLPGEIFVELGMAIKLASPFRYTIISELAGDMIDYVPDRKGFAEGGYEAVNSRCTPGGGEALVDAATRLLTATQQDRRPH
jgi:hypothetical protein